MVPHGTVARTLLWSASNRRSDTLVQLITESGRKVNLLEGIVAREGWILGLDLGTNSVGWAAVELRGGRPASFLGAGVRVFEAGLVGDLDRGRGEPRNRKRREARQRRRQTVRRARRLRRLFGTLQRGGLLPEGPRERVLREVDARLVERYVRPVADSRERRRRAHLLLYLLRARALDHRLEPWELGRALYHLGQRRGFRSNRKAPPRKDDAGLVMPAIADLERKIRESGARTLGEYLSGLDPERERVRARWTARRMYEREFDAIWEAQRRYHPELLTDELRAELRDVMFRQRPLRPPTGLSAACALEPGRRRALWARPEAQRFRVLQMLNNTRILIHETGEERPLTEDERRNLASYLEDHESLTFARAKGRLGFSEEGATFNWEHGGERRFLGNATYARLGRALGRRRWAALTDEGKAALVEDLISFEKETALRRRLERTYGLDPGTAEKVASIQLDPGRCSLSLKALRTILPYLEAGLSYSEARRRAYPDTQPRTPAPELPPVRTAFPTLRNPVVQRTLTEMRKVVNALVRRHGLPALVRVELARSLKANERQRRRAITMARANQRARERAARRLLEEAGVERPSRLDILKVLLLEECGEVCPYTGRPIAMRHLIGDTPEFEVEHILPFSRSFDNSFANLTLCHVDENRRKGNRTPWEAYGHDPDRFEAILSRVRRFQGPYAREKLRRFMVTEEDELGRFRSSQLSDTRYATRLALDYLALLYGGRTDAKGTLRVRSSTGFVTALLRRSWNLEGLLASEGLRQVQDHRRHAVDAAVVAVTDEGVIQAAARAAARQQRLRPSGVVALDDLAEPWPGFREELRETLAAVVVSHRPCRKARGALHEETIYGPPRPVPGGPYLPRHRKAVHELSPKEIGRIVDPGVRCAVEAQLAELGGVTDENIARLEEHPPWLVRRDGTLQPVRRVRLAKNVRTEVLGNPPRHVVPGANHHVEVFATVGRNGEPRWVGRMVTLLEVFRRRREGRPVVDRTPWGGMPFVVSLARGDMVLLEHPSGPGVFRVVQITLQNRDRIVFELRRHNDGRQRRDVERRGLRPSLDVLREWNCRKVEVTPLGEVRRAGG